MRTLLRNAHTTYTYLSDSSRALFLFLAGLCIISSVSLVYLLNESMLSTVPTYGGELTEGVIGSPRFINPVLAISDSDRDLTALVYSGLLRATPTGEYKPDLAESYTISPDQKSYRFTLRSNATFHNGTPVTADDVVFTIQKTQDAVLKSPARANWEGVVVTAIDPHTVEFTLKQPYAPFIQNLSIGILPKSLWQSVSDDQFFFSELNTQPIGSGPFRVGSISRNASGIPTSYTLKPFKNYALGAPYLGSLVLRFYQSEEGLVSALKAGDIEAASGISPVNVEHLSDYAVKQAPLNRVFGVFFNQNQSVLLRDRDVRSALDLAVDRTALLTQVLGGYGSELTGPVPPSILGLAEGTSTVVTGDHAALAQAQLVKAGWVVGQDGVLTKTTGKGKTLQTVRLEFNLATDNVPELRASAQFLKEAWGKMGAQVNVQIYDQGDLSQNVIRPRKYDALLFGEVIGRELDLYAFWHSSQRNDPGLNIALYANTTADKLLEKLRTTLSDTERTNLYTELLEQFKTDVPAVFLYTPDFVYIVPKELEGVTEGFVETPSDRFLSIAEWHTQTDKVWNIFVRAQR